MPNPSFIYAPSPDESIETRSVKVRHILVRHRYSYYSVKCRIATTPGVYSSEILQPGKIPSQQKMDGRLRRSLNDGSLPTPPPSYSVRGFCGFVWDSQLRHATDAWNTALLPHHPTLSEGGGLFLPCLFRMCVPATRVRLRSHSTYRTVVEKDCRHSHTAKTPPPPTSSSKIHHSATSSRTRIRRRSATSHSHTFHTTPQSFQPAGE